MSDAVFSICPEVTAVLAEVFSESKPNGFSVVLFFFLTHCGHRAQLESNWVKTYTRQNPFPGSVASFARTSLCLHREAMVRVA